MNDEKPGAPSGAGDGSGAGVTSRRGALFRIGIAINAVAAALLATPIIGFLLSPMRGVGRQKWISLGPLSDFPEQETRLATYRNPFVKPWDGETAHLPCWVRRISADSFQVFAINCTHLGCPVRWFQEAGLFLCPCHGGSFYADGKHAAGPPPRPLYQYEYKIEGDQLWVSGGELPTLSEPV